VPAHPADGRNRRRRNHHRHRWIKTPTPPTPSNAIVAGARSRLDYVRYQFAGIMSHAFLIHHAHDVPGPPKSGAKARRLCHTKDIKRLGRRGLPGIPLESCCAARRAQQFPAAQFGHPHRRGRAPTGRQAAKCCLRIVVCANWVCLEIRTAGNREAGNRQQGEGGGECGGPIAARTGAYMTIGYVSRGRSPLRRPVACSLRPKAAWFSWKMGIEHPRLRADNDGRGNR